MKTEKCSIIIFLFSNLNKKAFKYVGLDYKKYLKIDKKLFREKDSKARIANPKKLIKVLKWKRLFSFEKLVKDMVESELNNLKK